MGFLHPLDKVTEGNKDSPFFWAFKLLPNMDFPGRMDLQLSGLRQLTRRCGDGSLREGGGLGQELMFSTSGHLDLSECAGQDKFLLTDLLLVKWKYSGSSLWGKKEPAAQRLPSWGGWGGFCVQCNESLSDGLEAGGGVSWSQEQQEPRVIHFLCFSTILVEFINI